jgi:hypothetical protein
MIGIAAALGSCASPSGNDERVYPSLGEFELPAAVRAVDSGSQNAAIACA